MSDKVKEVVRQHEKAGKYFAVEGLTTFALDKGTGEAVLCIHGVPTSSFLYRKVISSLAEKGLRGICIDLPGLGLSDRPAEFTYTFENFADFLGKALQKLNIEKFHLVVHDIGGPIGFALAAKNLEKILSITILNTMVDIENFKKPLVMRPFEKKILGEAELKSINHLTWPIMFGRMGVSEMEKIPREEINAHVDLLKRQDNGKAFLKIMRNFTQTHKFQAMCLKALKDVNYPIQAIWGKDDPALDIDKFGDDVLKYTDVTEIQKLDSRHFLQEEVYEEIAARIYSLAKNQ